MKCKMLYKFETVIQGYSFSLRLRERGLNPVVPRETVASFFTLHCSSSVSCLNEYLAIDIGEYKCTTSINCSVAGCFPEKLDDVQLNRSTIE